MELIYYPSPLLKSVSEPIVTINEDIKTLISNLTELMISNRGVGISAIQAGYNCRLFLIYVNKKVKVFINPEIVAFSNVKVALEEGCLSIPNTNAKVSRPHVVVVKALNEHGKEFAIQADKMEARVIQHELDHLNGVLYFERIPDLNLDRFFKDY